VFDMEDILNELISIGEKVALKAKEIGADDIELYLVHNEVLNARLITNYVTTQAGIEVGVGVRVAIGKNVGFASVSSLEHDKIIETAKMAIKIAKAKGEDPNFNHLPDPVAGYGMGGIFDEDIYMMDPYELSQKVQDLVKKARDLEEDIKKLDIFATRSNAAFAVVNSRGISIGDYGSVFFTWMDINVVKNGKTGKGMDAYITRKFKIDDLMKVPEVATRMAREGLKAVKLKEPFVGDAVIGPFVMDSIIWPLWYNASALNVQEKRSRFVGMLGKEVANKAFTIYDDGTLPEGIMTKKCDAEGIPTMKKTIIENGILKTYLYDTYTAYRENRESTGNAIRRGGYRNQPQPGPTNLVIESTANKSLVDLIGEVDKGVLLRGEAMGAHTINPIKGTMGITCLNALYIENGDVAYPLKAVAMSEDYFNFLKKIEIVGSEYRITFNGKMPPLIVRNVNFG